LRKVGAFSNQSGDSLGTALAGTSGELSTIACPFCGAGCSVALVDGEAFPLLGDPSARGALCQRGWSAGELLFSPLRLVGARLRERGGTAVAVSVDVALERSAARLADIRGRHGGASIGILASARLTLEELRLLGDLARTIGTPHLDSMQRLGCVPEPSRGLDAIDGASRLTVVATDLAVRHPQAYRRVLEALERDVPVRWVGSQETALARLATERIHCLPGREVETAAQAVRDDELVLWSSEPALHGQGGPALRRFGGSRVVRLGDYVNQRALLAAGAFPGADGWSAYEMLLRAAAGELKALLIFADDPFEFFPDLAARAFAALEFVLVGDAVATRTTEAADAVLPGALLAEKTGTLVAADDSRRMLEAAHSPPAGISEGDVALRLVTLLGGEAGGARTPAFALGPDGPAADEPTSAFPFVAALDASTLWCGHALVQATITARREAWGPRADFPDGWVSLCAADAKALGVRSGWTVRVESDGGAVQLAVRIDGRTAEGTVGIPMSCWERAGTVLGALALDPCLRIPVFRPRPVRLSRT